MINVALLQGRGYGIREQDLGVLAKKQELFKVAYSSLMIYCLIMEENIRKRRLK